MSWKWVVDRRDGETHVDKRALMVAVVVGLAVVAIARTLLPSNLFYVALLPLAAVGIVTDIWIRKD